MRHALPMDEEHMYLAIKSRDARFDGWFFTGVVSTGIYCRPSCPALTPKRRNIRFYPSAAAAQQAGFRACKRCRPDAAPGSPEWNVRSDVVARAMRSIADGVVDRDGVEGLASHLGYSERHLNRLLVAEVGAGPISIARAQRAQTARVLIETTQVAMAEVAFASGFSSVRQFNDTIKEVFALTPSKLRESAIGNQSPQSPGVIQLRLPYRGPMDLEHLFRFLATRAIAGVEEGSSEHFARTMSLPHGQGVVELREGDPEKSWVRCSLYLDDLRDLGPAVQRCRRLLDLDADPSAIEDVLGSDRWLSKPVRALPGLRVPGHVDGAELAIRAVLGQQVSVAAAKHQAERLARSFGKPLMAPVRSLTHLFPSPDVIAGLGDEDLPMPASRRAAIRALSEAIADGEITLDAGTDREEAAAKLLKIPGIGPWTVSYIRMRALTDPDVFMPTDLGVRKALLSLGGPADPASAMKMSERWRPWRSYAQQYLWAHLATEEETKMIIGPRRKS